MPTPPELEALRSSLPSRLHRLGAVQFGEFRLKSGALSPVYCDLRLLISDPELLRDAAELYAAILEPLTYDRIAAVPYAGLPIGAATAIAAGKPMIFPRKEIKEYGTRRTIEGHWRKGERAVVLDDLVSNGASKIEAIAPLREAGLEIEDVVVLVDRRPEGSTDLEDAGLTLHAVATLREIARSLRDSGAMSAGEQEAIERFLS